MNLIFLNSMEKRVAEDRVVMAQVSICEEHGMWHVLWNEPSATDRSGRTSWYEGRSWNEMLAAFRARLRDKVAEGFVPLVDGGAESSRGGSQRSRQVMLLHYYGELHQVPEAFEQLRLWRRELAVKDGKTPYFIASNRVLRMIAAFLPHTVDELVQIPGLGDNRARRYEEAILSITKQYPRETAFPLDWVGGRIESEAFEMWLAEEAQRKERQETDRRQNKRKLLEAIAEGSDLASLHKLLAVKRSEVIESVEELVREGYDVDKLIEAELRAVDPELLRQADALFGELGDRYLKPVLHKLFTDDELAKQDVNRVYEWLRLYRLKYRRKAG